MVAEAEENNLDGEALDERFKRWHACSLCEQNYHGVVWCALGWACWKTYLGRPETDGVRQCAMNQLGIGLHEAKHDQDAVSVEEANLSMLRRIGAPEGDFLTAQSNLATSYQMLGRLEEALRVRQDTYSGCVSLYGEEHRESLHEAYIHATLLRDLNRFAESKSLLRKTVPVARRVLGESYELTLRMRWNYARALYEDPAATLDDLREAVTTSDESARIARRVFGRAHPTTAAIEKTLRDARAALRARETPSPRE